jgi:hypothetical protein
VLDIACRSGLETVSDALRGVSPSLVRQLMPIFDQLTPIYMDVAQVRVGLLRLYLLQQVIAHLHGCVAHVRPVYMTRLGWAVVMHCNCM